MLRREKHISQEPNLTSATQMRRPQRHPSPWRIHTWRIRRGRNEGERVRLSLSLSGGAGWAEASNAAVRQEIGLNGGKMAELLCYGMLGGGDDISTSIIGIHEAARCSAGWTTTRQRDE
ncbi:uncharacterized protein V6R79_013895 [Siganus canaliculatus]